MVSLFDIYLLEKELRAVKKEKEKLLKLLLNTNISMKNHYRLLAVFTDTPKV